MSLKFKILFITSIVFVLSSFNASAQKLRELPIGSIAPMIDQKMEDVSGRSLSLNEVAQENGLLVIFSSNTCPWIMKWEDRYIEISRISRENKIGMIALNPNESYRDRGDGMDDMIKRARKASYDFPYVLDKDHLVADAFGVTKTPYLFLFNGSLELVYIGAIDDNANNASSVKQHYIKDAIEQLISGQQLTLPTTKSLGCSIKRVG